MMYFDDANVPSMEITLAQAVGKGGSGWRESLRADGLPGNFTVCR